ncbi:PAS domain S-box protein [Myxococcus sp. MISCRS1]|uniref:PAS domain S-box protein n=1 Tax=Myxococcus TaxID=32 RepID=UPI001CBBFC74|nr:MULTISPECIES: PAS domain S-box protein [unclassified Myxococcus]MBZ4395206.1 PAS domain S-box protein [Myxococcus sp. AS-1-15]MCY0999438.1 PAS domain S-box protein [Myxococcus sp. MISCRS1]BDT30557.1 PAS domain S-box protein [Myxococcus sp. MH1]
MQTPPPRPDWTPHERRYRLVIDSLKEVVFQTDVQGRWTFLNRAWTEITGHAVDVSLGKSFLDFVDPEDHAPCRENLRRLMTREVEHVRIEVRYLTRDGGFRWVEVFGRVMVGEDGELVGTSGTLNDITERKASDGALARRERYLTALVEMQQRLLAVRDGGDLYGSVLSSLGLAAGASRVYVFDLHPGPSGERMCSQRAEWCAPGVHAEIDNPDLQNVPMVPVLERWETTLSRGDVIEGLVASFPEVERALLDPQGILSILVLPLRVQGALTGFVGFDNCSEARRWDRLEVDLLSAAAGAISVALERRESERALRERERRFRQLAENASDVLYLYRREAPRGFVYVSRVAHAKLGYGPVAHYGDADLWYRRVHPEDRAALEQLLEAPRASAGAPVTVRYLHPDGRMLWLEHVVVPVTDAMGRMVAVEGLARDITERRQAEEALRLSEASFRALLEGVPDAAAIERDGHIVYANAALVGTLGFERAEQLVGRQLSEFVKDMRGVEAVRAGALTGERRLVRRDGRTRVAEVVSLPLRFDGQPAVVSIARDVTEQRQLQARLTLADRLASVGTLAAGIAHEINNPLAFVLSNLSFLSDEFRRNLPPGDGAAALQARLRGEPDLAEWGEVLHEACEGAERVRQIVRQLKTFSRPDEERVSPLDVHTVLESVAMMAANEIRHRAQLKREYGDIPSVMANEGKLSQVFLNLVVNAAQAIPEGSAHRHEIRLATRRDGLSRVVVEVQDTGVGIAREVIDRIFDPFFTTKPVGVGTGLGLSICHSIVHGLGGEITVESEPGRGTTFRVVLPTTEPEARAVATSPEPSGAPVGPPRGRVLVVDDEPAVGRVLQRILRGHEVEVACSGRQALELLEQGLKPDAVLCDVMMPDLTGRDVYELVRRAHAGLEGRFVFVSGGAFTTGAREFLASIPNLLLEKPFDEGRVRRVVDDLVRLRPPEA